MTIDEMIAVLKAAKAGKVVQFQYAKSDNSIAWMDLTTSCFNFGSCEYRIKPEPREWWLIVDTINGDFVFDKKTEANYSHEKYYRHCPVIRVREVIES